MYLCKEIAHLVHFEFIDITMDMIDGQLCMMPPPTFFLGLAFTYGFMAILAQGPEFCLHNCRIWIQPHA